MTDRIPRRALSAILDQPWAIMPQWLDTIVAIAQRQGDPHWRPAIDHGKGETARTMEMAGSVAVIPLTGPIFPRANVMTEVSGATSLDVFTSALDEAAAGPASAIILDTDSPGGVSNGIAEAAERIRAVAAIKPVVAYVRGWAGSAAYWMISAANRIVMHRSAEAGSIGVVGAVSVQEQPDQGGRVTYEIVSSNAENKRPDPRTEAGRAELRRRVDAAEDLFIGDVAQFRGVERDTVTAQFGRGGLLIASDAVAAGMADAVAGFDETLAELIGQTAPGLGNRLTTVSRGATMSTPTGVGTEPAATITATTPNDRPLTAESIKADMPTVADALIKEGHDAGHTAGHSAGVAAGVAQERERQATLSKLAEPGQESLLAELRGSDVSVADAAIRLAEDRSARRDKALSARIEGAPSPVATPSAPTGDAPTAVDASVPVEERCKQAWENDAAVRGQFSSLAIYTAYTRNKEAGRIRHGKRPAE